MKGTKRTEHTVTIDYSSNVYLNDFGAKFVVFPFKGKGSYQDKEMYYVSMYIVTTSYS